MSEEIKKLDLKDLENAAGGKIGEGGDGWYEIVDGSGNGNAIGYYNTLEEQAGNRRPYQRVGNRPEVTAEGEHEERRTKP